jgi:hypothetical protein
MENGLTQVIELGSKLSALYNSESGVFHDGFYFTETLDDIHILEIEQAIEQADLEGVQ